MLAGNEGIVKVLLKKGKITEMYSRRAARSQGKVEKVTDTFSTVFTQPALVSVTLCIGFTHHSEVTDTMSRNRYQAL